jgi:hypothetical protein
MSNATTFKKYKFTKKSFVSALMGILEGGATKAIRYLYRRKNDLAPYAQVKATRVATSGEIRINYKYLTDTEKARMRKLNAVSRQKRKKTVGGKLA